MKVAHPWGFRVFRWGMACGLTACSDARIACAVLTVPGVVHELLPTGHLAAGSESLRGSKAGTPKRWIRPG